MKKLSIIFIGTLILLTGCVGAPVPNSNYGSYSQPNQDYNYLANLLQANLLMEMNNHNNPTSKYTTKSDYKINESKTSNSMTESFGKTETIHSGNSTSTFGNSSSSTTTNSTTKTKISGKTTTFGFGMGI